MPQRNTKDAIKEACLRLLEEKPLSQITVKAIVEECGINRNSFYYHFADMPSLLNEIVMDSADEIIRAHANVESLEECLNVAIQFARKNKHAVLHVFKSVNRGIYEQNLAKVCRDLVVSYCQTAFEPMDVSEADKEIMIRFYQCELMGQILLWLESDMRYDIQSQYSRLLELRKGFGMEMARRSAESFEKSKQ